MRKTKGFSYDPIKDKDVIEHLNRQQNYSAYIKELVRKDMKGSDIVEIVNRQIEEYLQKLNFSKLDSKEQMPSKITALDIDTNDIQSILNL